MDSLKGFWCYKLPEMMQMQKQNNLFETKTLLQTERSCDCWWLGPSALSAGFKQSRWNQTSWDPETQADRVNIWIFHFFARGNGNLSAHRAFLHAAECARRETGWKSAAEWILTHRAQRQSRLVFRPQMSLRRNPTPFGFDPYLCQVSLNIPGLPFSFLWSFQRFCFPW